MDEMDEALLKKLQVKTGRTVLLLNPLLGGSRCCGAKADAQGPMIEVQAVNGSCDRMIDC